MRKLQTGHLGHRSGPLFSSPSLCCKLNEIFLSTSSHISTFFHPTLFPLPASSETLSDPSLCLLAVLHWPVCSSSSCLGSWGAGSCPSAPQCAPVAGDTAWWTAPRGASPNSPQACSTTSAPLTCPSTGKQQLLLCWLGRKNSTGPSVNL